MIQRQRGDPWKPGTADLRAWCGAEKGQGGRAGLPDPCALHPSAPETRPRTEGGGRFGCFRNEGLGGPNLEPLRGLSGVGCGGGQEVTLAFSLQDKTPGLTQPSRLTRARPSECHSLPSRLTLLTFVDVTFFFSPWMLFQIRFCSWCREGAMCRPRVLWLVRWVNFACSV